MTEADATTWTESVRQAKASFASVDLSRLTEFLRSQEDIAGEVAISDYSGLKDGSGLSNGIGFFTADLASGNTHAQRKLVLRYMPGPTLMRQKSLADEFLTVRAAHAAGVPAPEALWLDADGRTLGMPGFVMARIDGDAPPAQIFASGPLAAVSATVRKDMLLQAARFHGELRDKAIGPAHVPHLMGRGSGDTAIERETAWLMVEAKYNAEEGDRHLQLVSDLRDWLCTHQPVARPATLTHGDAHVFNVMYRDNQLIAVLDWELSYLGHQEADVALLAMHTHLVQESCRADGTPTEDEYVSAFESACGAAAEHYEYFRVLSIYRYFVGVLWARHLLPDFEGFWALLEDRLGPAWASARAALR